MRLSWTAAAVLALALLPGCGRDEIKTYRVPKAQSSAPVHHPGDGHDHGAEEPQIPALTWKTPAGWDEVEPGQMRAASFRVKAEGKEAADVGVFPLPGLAGSDLDNVNRWRGQVGLEAIKADELATIAEEVEISGLKGQLYDLAGENVASGEKGRILAAILRREGVAWFFKMSGEDELVAGQKTAFKSFLESVQFTVPQAGELPDSHPPIEGMSPMNVSNSVDDSKPTWTVPATWKEVPAGQFLTAKFQIKTDAGEAAVNVSTSAGDGGGVSGNVNRWRGQLGLEVVPADKLDLVTIETTAGPATIVDLRGVDPRTNQKTRLIGAIVPKGSQTWFYKLMGDEGLVEQNKDGFLTFLKTVQY